MRKYPRFGIKKIIFCKKLYLQNFILFYTFLHAIEPGKMKKLQEAFLERLEVKYGKWDKTSSCFGTNPLGIIANDLSISASQFTKLLSGTATEGMYARSIDNVERLIRLDKALEEVQSARDRQQQFEKKLKALQAAKKQIVARMLGIFLFAMSVGGLALFVAQRWIEGSDPHFANLSGHPLSPFFDRKFNSEFQSPYLRESEVQDYCPCSAFEGTWSLAEAYKLPLPGNKKPGVYYLAKSADVRMKCARSEILNGEKGRVVLAYEYLINEIWVDERKVPLSPTYFNKQQMSFTQAFKDLDFERGPGFRKAATIHSFFINRFEIYKDSIVRKGEPCGRYASDVDAALLSAHAIDLKHILENVLSDLSQTNCSTIPNQFCDPNTLLEGKSTMAFDCLYTIKTENLGFGGGYPYRKGYLLQKQNYSNNLTCSCSD